jgi:hypothetical protein
MNCPRCGVEQRTQARFCANCGAPLPTSPPPAAQPPYVPPTQVAYTPYDSQPQPIIPTPYDSQPPPIASTSGSARSNRLWIYIAAGALGMVLIGVIAAIVLANVIEFPWSSKGVEKKVEEGIKIVSTKVGDIATNLPTILPTLETSIATIFEPLTEGTKPALPPFGETLMAPFFSGTSTPGSEVIEWFGNGENYQVEIQDGNVVGGSGKDNRYDWEATDGTYDGRFLVVTFLTHQRSDCLSEMTYTYDVEEDRLTLIQSVDQCGNSKTYNDRYYTRR